MGYGAVEIVVSSLCSGEEVGQGGIDVVHLGRESFRAERHYSGVDEEVKMKMMRMVVMMQVRMRVWAVAVGVEESGLTYHFWEV